MSDRPVLEIRYGARLLVLPVPAHWTGQIQLNIRAGRVIPPAQVKDRAIAYADEALEVAIVSGASDA